MTSKRKYFCVKDRDNVIHISREDKDVNAVTYCNSTIKYPKSFLISQTNCKNCLEELKDKE
jgi:hypothetical protein